ncbi:MAG: FAD-dependent oxidoreductase, partial [Fibrobacter sp.]|nr:FAD-dependent oxidoreductase [Fibrobacter sp.]
ASFAARMRRLDETAQIILFERGDYISFANCGLPYHIGETIKEREALIIQTPERFKARFNIDIRTASEVVAVDTEKKEVTVKHKDSSYTEVYDYLVLSPGAEPVKPTIPGIQNNKIFSLRTLPDMDAIKEKIDKGNKKRAVVIGGGFIGLEMAENLKHRGIDVTIVELLDQVFAPGDREMAQILHQHIQLNGVKLFLNNGAEAFADRADGTLDIRLKSGDVLNVDMAVLAIGVRPDTKFLKDSGIKVNERGAIIVDEHMRTSAADVFAVGDAIEVVDFVTGQKVHIPLAGPANRQGRIVADNIAGKDSSYKNTQGTAICRVFDLTAAVTGLSEKNAKRLGIKYLKSYTHSSSHASYYPGSFPLSIKIVFDPNDGKLLGAQVVGKDGVDKRIDVFATAIRHRLTVYDLTELELSYAPPFGSAKDAVNIAGFTAENILNGSMEVVYPDELQAVREGCTVLDVRTAAEHEQGAIEDSILIPVDSLRDRMNELDKSKPVITYCQVGLRGYFAARILMQNGFRVKNLSGGYKTYSTFRETSSEVEYSIPVIQTACSTPVIQGVTDATIRIDACELQCPGPIIKLKSVIDTARDGSVIEIKATDQGFTADIPSWCARTGNSLLHLGVQDGIYTASVRKGKSPDTCSIADGKSNRKTMVIFSNDLDKMLAAFIIANGAVAMGSEVTLFFTFWGLNILRKNHHVPVSKNFIEKMFSMMMPRGAKKVKLSKMNMAGMGTMMMQQVMKKKNVFSLEELIEVAQANKIRFVACSMSMDIMGIKKEELIDGVEIGGVASYLEKADGAGYNLFI